MYYVPSGAATDRWALRRHLHASTGNYLDAIVPLDPGQGWDAGTPLGFPFQKQFPGTQPIKMWFDPVALHHRTAFPAASSNLGDERSGHRFRYDGGLGFGYPRFGNVGERFITVKGAEVTLSANLVAGGVVNELWWGGKQFVNDYDFGRQIQFAVNLGQPSSGNPCDDNPTEGGDIYGWAKYPKKDETDPTAEAAWAHGSPIDLSGTGVDPRTKSLTTRCWPLQWNPGAWGWGTNHDHPVVWWRGTFSKQVTLDCRTADGFASPHLIQWTPTMYLPTTSKPISVQVVAGFLDADFHVYEMFDASREFVNGKNPIDLSARVVALAKQSPAIALDSTLAGEPRLNPTAGGSILSTPDGRYALGCYRGPSAANPNLKFALQDFRQVEYPIPPERKYSFQSAAFFLLYRPHDGLVGGQSYSFPVYLIVGNRATVIAEMQRLWRLGL